MPVIGVLFGASEAVDAFRYDAIQQGLRETGFVDGQSVTFERRWAENHYERLPVLMAELVQRQVNLIIVLGNAAARVAKAANTNIPIVFEIGDDPVKISLVASLARPGGNITGVTFLGGTLAPKLFELLHDALPQATIVGLLENPTNPNAEVVRRDVQAAANALGKRLIVGETRSETEIETAVASIVQKRADALLIRSDTLFNGRPRELVDLTMRHSLPAIFPLRDFAVAGGFMSYGASLTEALRQVGIYAGRVLKGEKPADLPVQQATKVELVVNLRTAKALGLVVPQTVLARADEVIE